MGQRRIPGIGEDVTDLFPVGADVSHLFGAAPPVQAPQPARPYDGKPYTAEEFTDQPVDDGWLGSAKRFVSGLAQSVDPRPALKLLYDASEIASPDAIGRRLVGAPGRDGGQVGDAFLADLKGVADAQVGQFRKAKEAYDQGRYSEAAGYTVAGVLPMLGPAAAHLGEEAGAGNLAGAAGGVAGMVAPVAVAKVLPKSVSLPTVAAPNAARQAAVDLALREGVPLDAATATGNRFVQAAQHVLDRSLGGSMVAQRAAQAQQQGLATVGEQLAAKLNARGGKPGPAVTPEQAGAALEDAVSGRVSSHVAEADQQYGRLRAMEADPANRVEIARTPEPGSPDAAGGTPPPKGVLGFSSKVGATEDEIFQGVLHDARNQGFTGRASDLRAAFDDQVASARRLGEDMASTAAENGPEALLTEIRRLGGVRPFVKDLAADGKGKLLREEFTNLQQSFLKKWGQRGAASVFRNDGLGLDDLAQQLASDPRFKGVVSESSDLVNMLQEIADGGPAAHGEDLQYLLRGAGVEKGRPWWKGTQADQADAYQAPVAMGIAKDALRPIYDQMAKLYPVAKQQASAGFKALKNIVNGPDYMPLSEADANLSAIKGIARGTGANDLPELRTVSQGLAAKAVSQVDDLVRMAAENMGPEALEALEKGRAATRAKYDSGDVLEGLRRGTSGEPVRMVKKITAGKDAAVEQLRALAKEAPDALPDVGRAVIDDLLAEATADGGFTKAQTIATKWRNLGAETKQVLFKDPAHVKDLDDFFHLAKLTAENSNPSGTAHTLLVAGQGGLLLTEPVSGIASAIGGAALSKLLHSPAGVRLLTRGMRMPLGSTAAKSYVAEVNAALRGVGEPALGMAADDQPDTAPRSVRR